MKAIIIGLILAVLSTASVSALVYTSNIDGTGPNVKNGWVGIYPGSVPTPVTTLKVQSAGLYSVASPDSTSILQGSSPALQ